MYKVCGYFWGKLGNFLFHHLVTLGTSVLQSNWIVSDKKKKICYYLHVVMQLNPLHSWLV